MTRNATNASRVATMNPGTINTNRTDERHPDHVPEQDLGVRPPKRFEQMGDAGRLAAYCVKIRIQGPKLSGTTTSTK
jgi:hypothetical protein